MTRTALALHHSQIKIKLSTLMSWLSLSHPPSAVLPRSPAHTIKYTYIMSYPVHWWASQESILRGLQEGSEQDSLHAISRWIQMCGMFCQAISGRWDLHSRQELSVLSHWSQLEGPSWDPLPHSVGKVQRGLFRFGFGNWKEIKEELEYFGAKYSEEELETHYYAYYLSQEDYLPVFLPLSRNLQVTNPSSKNDASRSPSARSV